MYIGICIISDKGSYENSDAINLVSNLLEYHFKNIEYEAIFNYIIVCYATNCELFKPVRHRFQERRSYIDIMTKEHKVDYGTYSCEFKFTQEEYKYFCAASMSDAAKVIARGVVDTLSNLDRLSKKAAAFDKDHFRAEVVKLFKENDLIPDDYPLPWNNKKERTRTKASQDLG